MISPFGTLELTFKEAEIIVSCLRDRRNEQSNSIRYSKGRIQDEAGKPFSECDESDGKKYEWHSIREAISKFDEVNGMLSEKFGIDEKEEPEAPEFKPEKLD
jgi:hypothetical protein